MLPRKFSKDDFFDHTGKTSRPQSFVDSPALLRGISVAQPELFTARYCILLPGCVCATCLTWLISREIGKVKNRWSGTHNPLVVGSSPTGPTTSILCEPARFCPLPPSWYAQG